jgi:hypothetical protein
LIIAKAHLMDANRVHSSGGFILLPLSTTLALHHPSHIVNIMALSNLNVGHQDQVSRRKTTIATTGSDVA